MYSPLLVRFIHGDEAALAVQEHVCDLKSVFTICRNVGVEGLVDAGSSSIGKGCHA